MLNRKQRRSFKKKGYDPDVIELTTEVVQMGAQMAAAGFGDVLPEATVVKINPETYERGNTKRERWIENHLDQELTIEYDPKWGDEPRIYCLVEDDSNPKWYFVRNEFIVLERAQRNEKSNDRSSKEQESDANAQEEENLPYTRAHIVRKDRDG